MFILYASMPCYSDVNIIHSTASREVVTPVRGSVEDNAPVYDDIEDDAPLDHPAPLSFTQTPSSRKTSISHGYGASDLVPFEPQAQKFYSSSTSVADGLADGEVEEEEMNVSEEEPLGYPMDNEQDVSELEPEEEGSNTASPGRIMQWCESVCV